MKYSRNRYVQAFFRRPWTLFRGQEWNTNADLQAAFLY
jgi:hypothetical protein